MHAPQGTMCGVLPAVEHFRGAVNACSAGHYVWYSLRLNVSEAPSMGTLDVSATVRQAVALQVPIRNPLHDLLTFDLTYGSDQLVGPDTLALQPKESCNFKFFFAPLVEGDNQALVTFSSFKVQTPDIVVCVHKGRHVHYGY